MADTAADRSLVIDADVHLHERPADLAPFAEMPWRRGLENEPTAERWLDTPGYSPFTPLDPIRGVDPTVEPYMVRTPEAMRADLDRLGTDIAVMMPDRFIRLAASQNSDYAVAIADAYNRYLQEQWLDARRGLYGVLLVPNQDPHAAARQILTYAAHDGIAGVLLSTVNISPLWGDRFYDPIFAAAQEAGLPVVLHGATAYGSVFPMQLQSLETAASRGALSQPLAMMANVTAIVLNGVFERFPRLKSLCCEAGLAWLPFLAERLDGQYRVLKADLPALSMKPSEYLRRQVWVTTHPLGGLSDAAAIARIIAAIGADRVVFASDWPHFDHDEPVRTASSLLPADQRDQIMGRHAQQLFRFQAAPP